MFRRASIAVLCCLATLFALSATQAQSPALVRVTTDKLNYKATDPIDVFIFNGNNFNLLADTGQSYNTIVALQHQIGANAWQTIGIPISLGPIILVTIKPGETYETILPANSPKPGGLYRIQFTFQFESLTGIPTGVNQVSYSPSFQIAPPIVAAPTPNPAPTPTH